MDTPAPEQTLPGPRTAALQGAFASALSGPRWENGQRPDMMPEVMYPPTPVAPFPFSLHHREDPFSRAVSPIHGDLDAALEQFKPNAEPVQFADPFQYPIGTPNFSQQADTPFTPAMIALNKIRKPSLHTLMSQGSSQASSRQVSPVPESPTLFDQPMPVEKVDSMQVMPTTPAEPWETPKDVNFDLFHNAA